MRRTAIKSLEELSALKEKVESLNKKLAGLTEEELREVSGGGTTSFYICGQCKKRFGRVGTTADTVTCKCGGIAKLDEIWNY